MKFSCERCQTRYSIGDDKVRGKVLKISCKTCGNIIVVREQIPTVQGEASGYAVPHMLATGGGSSGVSSSHSSPPAPAAAPPATRPQGKVEWYIAIKGKQHGPASHDDVVRLFRDGRISDRTYLWHDQLPSWIRIRELPEFQSVVAEGQQPKRPPPPPSEEGAEIVNFEAARAQRQQKEPLGPVLNDPFAAIGPGPAGSHDAPRESTRVFIMQAGLHNRASKHKLYAGVAAAVTIGIIALGVIDYQLDILGLKRVVDAVAVSTGIKAAPVDDGPGWGDVEADPAIKCKLQPNFDDCVKKETAKIAKRGGGKRKPPKIGGSGVSNDDLAGAFGTAGAGGGDTVGGVGVTGDGFVNVGIGAPSNDDIKRMLGSGKAGPSGPKASIELPSTIGSTIDADNAKKVVTDGQGGIQSCVDTAMKNGEDIPGKVKFTLSIGMKGTIERVVANNAVVGASTLGTCLTSTMRKWKFAPPTEPADLEIPLILR
jgi:predicted Zn finger-like uncharacterized protein